MTIHSLNKKANLPDQIQQDPVGIGLRHPYYQDVLDSPPDVGWFEVHPENFFGGGAPRHYLREAAKSYPISLHAVGLSLGSDQPVCENHLASFKELIDEFDPFNVSDHVSWSASGNAHLGDLLPLPYTQEVLDRLASNIDITQNYFGRQILVENPSTYLSFEGNEMHEDIFMNKIAEMTGCGILLDINNIYVQANNHGFDAWSYISTIEPKHVGEMHLAGHTERHFGDDMILVDTHNRPVKDGVWDLYEHAIGHLGVIPTLIEWDQDFPTLDELVGEANKARTIIQKVTEPQDIAYAAE